MSPTDRAELGWGESMPDWIRVLAESCASSSQSKIALELGYSPAVVNTVLSNTYKGDLSAVQQAVEGALMAATVNCPVLGEMRANICLQHQKAKFAATSFIRVRLFKACRGGCKHSRLGG